MANFHVQQKLVEKAIEEYNAALQEDANVLSAHMGLGMIYDAQQKYDKAKEDYQKALKIHPNFAPAANNLAYLFAETGENIDVTLNLAQSAKQQFPDDPSISDTLGRVYYKKNIFGRAIVYLKKANEKITDNPTMRYDLWMAYYKNENRDQARKELKKALELDPKFRNAEAAKEVLSKLK